MENLEESVKQYTESLQNRITELLTDVDKSKIDKAIIDRLTQTELLNYTDKVIKNALNNCLNKMTDEVTKVMKKVLSDVISEDNIRKTLLDAEVKDMMTKALCKRVAASIEEGYY